MLQQKLHRSTVPELKNSHYAVQKESYCKPKTEIGFVLTQNYPVRLNTLNFIVHV
jgi:hypothetical protein